jgi:hypothetical protein
MTHVAAKRLLPSPDRRRGARAGAVGGALARTAVGVALLARPQVLPRGLGVDRVTARRMAWVVRLFAARDAALGLGTVYTTLTGRPVRPWLLAQAAVDVVDGAVLAVAVRTRQVSLPRGLAVVAVAAGGALGGLVTAVHADAGGEQDAGT